MLSLRNYVLIAICLLVVFWADFLMLVHIAEQNRFERYQGPAHYANGDIKR